jgi:hypothetical protein
MIPSRSGVHRLYEWLIRAYPAHFRARFEHGMRDSFQKDFDGARVRGRTAVISFLMPTAVDLVRFGLAERFRSTPHVRAEAPKAAMVIMMKSLLTTDLRDAWRSLRATPVVTAVAVLSLALGIGGNTALFSILDSLVLKSLPVRDPAQLALLENGDWTNPIWEALRAHERQIGDGAFAWSATRFDLAEGRSS